MAEITQRHCGLCQQGWTFQQTPWLKCHDCQEWRHLTCQINLFYPNNNIEGQAYMLELMGRLFFCKNCVIPAEDRVSSTLTKYHREAEAVSYWLIAILYMYLVFGNVGRLSAIM